MDFDEAQAVAARYAPHDYYEREYRAMERMYLPSLFKHLEGVQPTKVLEIGPGWGTTAAWLSDRGHDVTVMDLMPLGTFMTQELLDTHAITYVHNDIEDRPFPEHGEPSRFDLVILTQVIPHLAWRPDRTLRHITELMTPSGTFVTSVLDRKNYRTLDATFGDDWHAVPEWGTTEKCTDVVKCMYTKKTFASLLRTSFSHVRIWKPMRSTVLFAEARI